VRRLTLNLAKLDEYLLAANIDEETKQAIIESLQDDMPSDTPRRTYKERINANLAEVANFVEQGV